MAEILRIRGIEVRGQEYGVDTENARIPDWAGVKNEAVPVGNGNHGTKVTPVVPQLVAPVIALDLNSLSELKAVKSESIIAVCTNGVRLLLPNCDFAEASELGADYVTLTYNVGGSPIQL